MIRSMLKKILPAGVRRWIRRMVKPVSATGASANYEILSGPPANGSLVAGDGWQHPDVARQQHDAFGPLLDAVVTGRPRRDFEVLAAAVQGAGVDNPSILELGCGSGWNFRVLELLYSHPFKYTGLDCSGTMLEIARQEFPAATFVRGDAVATPFADECCDILVSGTVLMHLADYRAAIREARRLARQACVFHTVPVTTRRPTTYLRKLAYGQPTVEVVFNEAELLACFAEAKLRVTATFDSLDYDLRSVLGEPTKTKTYLCLPTV